MSTPAQIAANRANSLRSTGARTEAGKAASSQNNFRHGFRGKFRLLDDEDPSEYESLLLSLMEEHQPSTPTEQILVANMAQHQWLRERALRFQHDALSPDTPDTAALALWMRYEATNERAFFKCLTELNKIRDTARREKIGFERQKHVEAAEQRKTEMHQARLRSINARFSETELENEVKAQMEGLVPGATSFSFEDALAIMERRKRSRD